MRRSSRHIRRFCRQCGYHQAHHFCAREPQLSDFPCHAGAELPSQYRLRPSLGSRTVLNVSTSVLKPCMPSTKVLVLNVFFGLSGTPIRAILKTRKGCSAMTSVALTMLYAAEPILLAVALIALLRSREQKRFPALLTLRFGSALPWYCTSYYKSIASLPSTTQPRTRCTSIPTGQATSPALLSSSW